MLISGIFFRWLFQKYRAATHIHNHTQVLKPLIQCWASVQRTNKLNTQITLHRTDFTKSIVNLIFGLRLYNTFVWVFKNEKSYVLFYLHQMSSNGKKNDFYLFIAHWHSVNVMDLAPQGFDFRFDVKFISSDVQWNL